MTYQITDYIPYSLVTLPLTFKPNSRDSLLHQPRVDMLRRQEATPGEEMYEEKRDGTWTKMAFLGRRQEYFVSLPPWFLQKNFWHLFLEKRHPRMNPLSQM